MEFIPVYPIDPVKLEPELLACRVCLGIGLKLFYLQYKLAEYYEEVTGIQVSPFDGLPQHVCSHCAALLRRAASFRARSLHTHSALVDYISQMGKLTNESLPQIDTLSNRALATTAVEILSISGEDSNKLKHEDDSPVFSHTDDFYIDVDIKEYESDREPAYHEENITEKKELKRKKSPAKKRTAKKRRVTKIDPKKLAEAEKFDEVKEYCLINLNDNNKFCQFILDKYIYKTLTKENTQIAVDEIECIDEIPTEIKDNKTQFYDYIVEKYIEKKVVDRKAIVRKLARKNKQKKKKTYKDYKIAEAYAKFANEHKCDVLQLESREQKIEIVQKRKELERYINATFKCEICYTGFTFEKTYKKHMLLHDENAGPNECDVCHVRYASRRRLKDHYSRHSVVITCKLCSKVTYNTNMAKQHYNTHTGQEYKCEPCGKMFTRYKSRLAHMRLHHGTRQCDICYSYFTPAGYRQHYAVVHKQTFPCSVCEAVFSTASARDRHTQGCPHGTPCTRCGESLPTEDEWRRHVNTQHSRANTEKEAKMQHPSYPFYKRKWPSEENRTEDGECPRGPGRPRTVGNEESDDRTPVTLNYMCEYCAKSFATEYIMQAHQRVHTGEKPYQCSTCPKAFRIKLSLQAHERTHTGDRPFECPDCGKAFKTYTARNRHQNNVHRHLRRHRCHLCNKTFQTSTCVKMHVNSVHLKIPSKPRIRNRRPRASPISEA